MKVNLVPTRKQRNDDFCENEPIPGFGSITKALRLTAQNDVSSTFCFVLRVSNVFRLGEYVPVQLQLQRVLDFVSMTI